MDEWTKEDIAKMEAEAQKEIERNFPSYFDDLQTTFFNGDYKKDSFEQEVITREISVDEVFSELLALTEENGPEYKSTLLRDRLNVVRLCFAEDSKNGI